LLPVSLGSIVEGGSVSPDRVEMFSKDVDFGQINELFDVGLVEGARSVASAGNSSLIAYSSLGEGFVVYNGVFSGEDFKLSTSYPIFWVKLVKFLSGERDVNDLNYKTGVSLRLEDEFKMLDSVGTYDVGNYKVAANMLRVEESDVFGASDVEPVGVKNFKLKSVKDKIDYKLMTFLVMIAFILSLIELGYVKSRGEF